MKKNPNGNSNTFFRYLGALSSTPTGGPEKSHSENLSAFQVKVCGVWGWDRGTKQELYQQRWLKVFLPSTLKICLDDLGLVSEFKIQGKVCFS